MRDVFLKLFHGLLYGVGIIVAIAVFSFIWDKTDGFGDKFKSFDKTVRLEVIDYQKRNSENGLLVLGTLKNNDKDSWGSIQIEAELFDSENNFLDECTTNLSQYIEPGNIERFKITCSDCQNRIADTVDHVELKIINAYAKRNEGI